MSEFATYLGANRVLVRTTWGGKLITLADDLSITPDLCAFGEYDPPFLHFLTRALGPGDVAVDVGANIGLFTVRMAELVGPTGSVVALEPNPDCAACLKENVGLNYQSEWVEVHELAADAAPGRATLHASERFRGNSTLEARTPFYRRHFPFDDDRPIEVAVVALDDLLEGADRIRLLKIDVEGAEQRVLRGARRIIAEGRVDLVDVELCRPASNDWESHAVELRGLSDQGAVFSVIAPDGGLEETTLEDVLATGWFPHLVAALPGADTSGLQP